MEQKQNNNNSNECEKEYRDHDVLLGGQGQNEAPLKKTQIYLSGAIVDGA